MEEFEHDLFRILVSIPAGQPPKNGWPVLAFLHGRDEAAPAELGSAMTLHGPLNPQAASIATQEFLVIAPQLPAPGGNVWGSKADHVKSLAQSIASERCGNTKKMYLTGFSFGGNGVLRIGVEQPDVWAALWAVDPTEPPMQRAEQPIWISAGQYSRRYEKEFKDKLKIPVWMPDETPSTDGVYEDSRLSHVETAKKGYSCSAAYAWLSKH